VRTPAHAVAATFDLTPAVAAERLGGAVVGVVGSAPAGVEIARLLRASGVGDVQRSRWKARERFDLAVVTPAGNELEQVESWNLGAQETCVPWLPVRPYDGRFVAVGPLFIPGESCCFECVLRRRAANVEYGEFLREIEAAPLAARADATFEAMAVAFAAQLALRWIAGRDPTLPGVLHAVEARPALSLREHPVLRVPRCPVCSSTERLPARLPWHGAEAA